MCVSVCRSLSFHLYLYSLTLSIYIYCGHYIYEVIKLLGLGSICQSWNPVSNFYDLCDLQQVLSSLKSSDSHRGGVGNIPHLKRLLWRWNARGAKPGPGKYQQVFIIGNNTTAARRYCLLPYVPARMAGIPEERSIRKWFFGKVDPTEYGVGPCEVIVWVRGCFRRCGPCPQGLTGWL